MKSVYTLVKTVVVLYTLIAAMPAWSQNGVLDQTFGVAGKVPLSYNSRSVQQNDIKIQPDQKILVLSMLAKQASYDSGKYQYKYLLSRLLPNGQPDASFGANGRVEDSLEKAYAIALQPDGKILVTGATWGVLNNMFVTRYNANGTRDNSFGASGKVTVDMTVSYGYEESTSIFVLSNGAQAMK